MTKSQTLTMKVDLEFMYNISPGFPATRDCPEEPVELNIESLCVDGCEVPDFGEYDNDFEKSMYALLENELIKLAYCPDDER